jgi:hypothetical protein
MTQLLKFGKIQPWRHETNNNQQASPEEDRFLDVQEYHHGDTGEKCRSAPQP